MLSKFRPWLYVSLAALMVAVMNPKDASAIDLIYTGSVLTAPDDPVHVQRELVMTNRHYQVEVSTSVPSMAVGAYYDFEPISTPTAEGPWQASSIGESPQEAYLDRHYTFSNNFSISDLDVDKVTASGLYLGNSHYYLNANGANATSFNPTVNCSQNNGPAELSTCILMPQPVRLVRYWPRE